MATNLTAPPPPAPIVEVVSNPMILGGMPTVHGTRIPAQTILLYIRDGASLDVIYTDYPTLPLGGVEAVERWARTQGLL
jgi:uncharacterized protein (DUF433 family)